MRYLLLLAFLPTLLLFVAVLSGGNITLRDTISRHIARSPRLIVIGRVCISLISLLVLSWFLAWYKPGHTIGIVPLALFVAICIAATTLGLIPYIEGTRAGNIHNTVAWSYVFMLPILLLSWAWYEQNTVRSILILCGVIQIGLLILARANKKAWNFFFIFEGSYILLFGLALLGVAYGTR